MTDRNKPRKFKLSKISTLHYVKLVWRSLLLLMALGLYLADVITGEDRYFGKAIGDHFVLNLIWVVYLLEMILRFFPSSFESMGCQKQFGKNYKPTGVAPEKASLTSGKAVLAVAISWIALNSIFGVLYAVGILDKGILILISLAFAVCDMICILFYCPFQTLYMKNKCCTSCRIYNWDFAMMFTPLVFIGGFYALSLFALGMLLLIVWEINVYRHPERFAENTNKCLSCGQCQEKLCSHKKQLKSFLAKNRALYKLKDNILFIQEKISGKSEE